MNDEAAMNSPLAARTCGQGPALVLFHGGMGSWNHWIRNIDALAERFTVHAIDLPGYGDSPGIPRSIAHDEYIDRVLAGLRPVVGESSFCLAGFSFGGVIAAMRKLSLLGVGGFGPPPAMLPMRAIPEESAGAAARREVFRYNLCVMMIADPAKATDEAVDLHAENFRRTRYDGRSFSLSDNVATALRDIACPVQFIYGAKDALGVGDLERREQIVRSRHSDARFVVLPGAGHWVQYEAPEGVNRLLLEFFSG
jgi:2-hydroxy-6-oxonona-2,4-dienedioate hydrolase